MIFHLSCELNQLSVYSKIDMIGQYNYSVPNRACICRSKTSNNQCVLMMVTFVYTCNGVLVMMN